MTIKIEKTNDKTVYLVKSKMFTIKTTDERVVAELVGV